MNLFSKDLLASITENLDAGAGGTSITIQVGTCLKCFQLTPKLCSDQTIACPVVNKIGIVLTWRKK